MRFFPAAARLPRDVVHRGAPSPQDSELLERRLMASRPWTAPIIAERNRRRYWEAGGPTFRGRTVPFCEAEREQARSARAVPRLAIRESA